MHKVVFLLSFLTFSLTFGTSSFSEPNKGKAAIEVDASDLLLARSVSLTTISLTATVACEIMEFCHIVNPISSRRIIAVDFSELGPEKQRLMFDTCAPGPCRLKMRGSFSYDEILVSSFVLD